MSPPADAPLADRIRAAVAPAGDAARLAAAEARALAAIGGGSAPPRLDAGRVAGGRVGPWLSRVGRAVPALRWLRNQAEGLVARLPVSRRRYAADLAAREAALAELVGLARTVGRGAASPPFPREEGAPRVAWVSSWNTRCGIAEYSRTLLAAWPPDAADVRVFADHKTPRTALDGPGVSRCWHDFSRGDLGELAGALRAWRPALVVLQFHFAFFALRSLGPLLAALRRAGTPVVVVFHATADVDAPNLRASLREVAGELAGAARLLVHTDADRARLAALGLVDRVEVFPHGLMRPPPVEVADARAALGLAPGTWVGSFGFLTPDKGAAELVAAVAALRESRPDLRLLLLHAAHDAPAGALRRRIRDAGLDDAAEFVPDFLPIDGAVRALQAMDLLVFPYRRSGESASGAVRIGVASGRPVAVTDLPLFADLGAAVHRLPPGDPSALAAGLGALLDSPGRRATTADAQARYLEAHAYDRVGPRLWEICRAALGGS